MMIAFVFSVLLYLLLFSITFLTEALLHFSDLSVELVLSCMKEYLLDGIGVFLAISPIIAVVPCMKKVTGWHWYLPNFIPLPDCLRVCQADCYIYTLSTPYSIFPAII